jgi:hypothetical protein
LTQAIFTPLFMGENFASGVVFKPDVPFSKEAASQLHSK